MEKEIVQVESMLEEIMPIFMGALKEDFSQISSSLSEGDFKAIMAIAHKIKGNAGGYGFDQLGLIAKKLEDASREQNKAECLSHFKHMVAYMGNIQIEYVE